MKNIDLSKYKLISPSNITKKKGNKIMYDIQTKNKTFVIHTDSINILSHNCDGQHIASLIVNFFWKWFPDIVKAGRLHKLVTPLVASNHHNNRKYFYTTEEFEKYKTKYKLSNINYLKGLGSLSLDDWEFVMADRVLFQIQADPDTDKYLEMAFGLQSAPRKLWLQGIVN